MPVLHSEKNSVRFFSDFSADARSEKPWCTTRHELQRPKVDKERYSTPALGGKMRGGGMVQTDDVTNIFDLKLQISLPGIRYFKRVFAFLK